MHKITNVWKFELNWSSKLRDNNGRNTPLSYKVLCFGDAWFWELKIYLHYKVSKSNLWKIISFSKTTQLQRKPSLTKCIIISTALHCLLPSKFYANTTVILSNYQYCSLRLIQLRHPVALHTSELKFGGKLSTRLKGLYNVAQNYDCTSHPFHQTLPNLGLILGL